MHMYVCIQANIFFDEFISFLATFVCNCRVLSLKHGIETVSVFCFALSLSLSFSLSGVS